MLPYCGNKDDVLDPSDPRLLMADWDCIRGCTLGILSIFCFGICLYSTSKVAAVWMSTRWYSLHVLMLSLATLQCFLTSIRYLVYKEQRLTYTAAYLRGLQTLITCANYGRAASESNEFLSKYYFPTLIGIVCYLTIIYFVALSIQEFDCYHPYWILMSVSQFVIVLVFTLPATIVLKNLYRLDFGGFYERLTRADSSQLVQQRRGLSVLLLVNAIGALAQLILDAWLFAQYSDQNNCAIFETVIEELLRIVLETLSYDIPVIAAIYVYYWLPRHAFNTGLDIQMNNVGALLDGEFSNEPDDVIGEEFAE